MHKVCYQRRDQRQGKVAVSDGLAIGQLARGTFLIDVNPLMIASGFRKLINHLLVDDDPVGDAHFDVHELLRILD